MAILRSLGRVFTALGRTWWLLLGYAVLGAAVSVLGSMAVMNSGFGTGTDASLLFTLLPAIVAHVVFLLAASRAVASVVQPGPLPRPGARQAAGVLALSAMIAITGVVAGKCLPVPQPFLIVIALAAVLAWMPVLPALALGRRMTWSFPAFATAVFVSLPFLAVSEILGIPAQTCTGECWGIMEGGVVMIPVLAAHMFLSSVTAAIVSTVIYTAGPAPGTAETFV